MKRYLIIRNHKTNSNSEKSICKKECFLILSVFLLFLLAVSCQQIKTNSDKRLSWRYKYDKNDMLSKTINPAGKVTTFKYSEDQTGSTLIIKKKSDGNNVELKFEESGLLCSMKDILGNVNYQYDVFGRLIQFERTGEAAVRYRYDMEDRITNLEVGDFYNLSYTYDFMGRLSAINTPVGTINYEYRMGQGQIIRKLPNGVKTLWEFGANGQQLKTTHLNPENYILIEFRYQYRPDGLIDAIVEKTQKGEKVTFYKYDNVGRLIQVSDRSDKDYKYEYDLLGNRLRSISPDGKAQISEYDWAGRLTSYDGKECSYDAAGNLNTIHFGDSEMKYKYFQDQQLANVNDQVYYKYSGDGKLLERQANGEITKFISDPLADFWQPLVIDNNTEGKDLLIWDNNTPLINIKNGKPEFILNDHLGSARIIVDSHGEVKQQMDYSPFGKPDYRLAGNELTIGFSGLLYDPDAKLYLTKARAYNPNLGQFMQIEPEQRTPMGSQKNLSLYAYCGYDPVNFVDFNGARPRFIWGQENWVWQLFHNNPFTIDYVGEWTNIYGTGTNWGGKNRSGGVFSRKKDIFGEFPLGDPNVLPQNLRDKFYRRHDIQLFIDGHYKKGDLVNVGSKAEPEYYISNGYSSSLFNKPNRQLYLDELNYRNLNMRELQSSFDYKGLKSLPQEYSESDVKMLDRNNPENWTRIKNNWGPENWTWQLLHTDWFDRDYAKEYYAGREINTQSNVMSWVWGTIGGYIPGEAKTVRQKYISDIWDFVPVISTSRTFVSSLLNSKEGKIRESFTDILSLGVGYIGDTKNIDRIGKQILTTNLEKYITNQSLKNANISLIQGKRLIDHLSKVELFSKASNKLLDYKSDLDYSSSNVGGVSLSGAGDALDGVGQIEGLTIDANNNLILISKNGEQNDMPSMRIDDVVTVFRSVYIHGEGPNVTIDPNPKDPEHSAMIIKHGKATENTYVGWVLYHCDRLMKGYMLGVDNITQKDVTSHITGYKDVLNTIYFGDGISNSSNFKGKWERFWIVPAEVNQFSAEDNNLTLFDVPLMLKTQVMKWENGELVDNILGKSSVGARNFTKWFTSNYDAIAKEQYLMPPAGFGIKDSVQVFSELRQIALITALAEKMRDQGVAMPFWMRDYEIKQVLFEKQTPALLITQRNGNVVARIFGGVSLSVNSKEVKQFKEIADLNQLPEEVRMKGEQNLKLANALSTNIREFNSQSIPLQQNTLEIENESFQTIQLPGAETKALSPCRIDEVDMMITISGGNEIHLPRHFNSFFNPREGWGRAWTMNLPRLEKIKIPTQQSTNNVSYLTAYELITPLNSMYVKFANVKEVPTLNTQLQVPDIECDFFGLVNSSPKFIGIKTLELIGKTGESWYFTEHGDLIAIEKDGFRVVYLRNQAGNVKQIIGLLGGKKMASIDIVYDQLNKLISATGKNEFGEEKTVTYEYNSSGDLNGVISEKGKLTYNYENRMVSAVGWQDQLNSGVDQNRDEIILHRFEYNNNGQLIAKYDGQGIREEYKLASSQGETTLNIDCLEKDHGTSSIRYDTAFRPVEIKYSDGSQATWRYSETGESTREFIGLDGKKTFVTESADKTKRTIKATKQPMITETYDQMGRLTDLNINEKNLFHQQWSPVGILEALETENSVIKPQYDESGLTECITFFPSGSEDPLREWETVNLDFAGRPVKITDHSGLNMAIQYDSKGEVSQFITERDGGNYGYKFSRNDIGQIETVHSSWGNEICNYDSAGVLSKLIINKTWFNKQEQASIIFDSGRLQQIKQFDGGVFEISYFNEGLLTDLPGQIICPNGLELSYHYNSTGNLDKVNVGSERQVRVEYDDKGRITGYSFNKK